MESLEGGYFYHIYNRGNNKQKVFIEEKNYAYFLKLMKKYLLPIAEIYCYCLLPNHFHILLRIKEGTVNPAQKFSNLFNAYTKAINKEYKRTGNLFDRTYKRKKILDENYLRTLVVYIHLNPKPYNLQKDHRNYPYSSYQQITNVNSTFLQRKEVLDLFDDKENFEFVHQRRKNALEKKL